MKAIKKSILLGFLVLALSALFSVNALAADSSAISVQVNDKTISFADAVPAARNGRVFLPFRAVFEALEAQVSYNEDDYTVTAVRGDTSVSFVIGQASVEITDGSGTRTVQLDAASYAENSRVMVPVRAAAEAFGCNVGWDNAKHTVLILDTRAILGANDAQYALMDRYLAFSQKYQKSPYAVSGTFDLSMEMTSGGQTIPFVTNATISGLYNDTVINMDTDMTIDLSDLISATGGELDAESQMMISLLQNIRIEYILDLSDGMMYMRSPLISLSLGVTDSNAWVSVDLNKMMGGLDMMSISRTEDFKEYIQLLTGLVSMTDTGELTEAAGLLRLINSSCCDGAFVKDGNTYTNTLSYTDDSLTAQGNIVFRMERDNIASIAMSLTLNSDEFTLDMTYDLDENDALTMTMNLSAPDELNMSLQYDLKYTQTDQLPESAPEEGSTVIPMNLPAG